MPLSDVALATLNAYRRKDLVDPWARIVTDAAWNRRRAADRGDAGHASAASWRSARRDSPLISSRASRLHQFVLMSDAYVVVPGGIGTVLEIMMVWQLLQVRHLRDTPLILAGPRWRGLVDWASAQMLRPGFELAGPEDMTIPRCVDDADGAVAVLREHHARWLAGRPTTPQRRTAR